MNLDDDPGHVDPLAVLELLTERGASFPARVAGYLDPALWVAAHATDPEYRDVVAWAGWVAQVARLVRAVVFVGVRDPAHASTLAAVTDVSEGQLLISLAEQHDHPEVVELLETWLDQLHARGPDGRPLHEDPTGAHAAVVHLADRTPKSPRPRRTS